MLNPWDLMKITPLMPSHTSANPEIKQLFVNGHFCYIFKFGITLTVWVSSGIFPSTIRLIWNHIQENLCLAGRYTQNEQTLHADLILAGITQLITVILTDKILHPEYIRSLKSLIA